MSPPSGGSSSAITCSASSDERLDGADIPTEFVPAEPPGVANARTVVWQYLENALFLGARHGTVDMNMATTGGLAGMDQSRWISRKPRIASATCE